MSGVIGCFRDSTEITLYSKEQLMNGNDGASGEYIRQRRERRESSACIDGASLHLQLAFRPCRDISLLFCKTHC